MIRSVVRPGHEEKCLFLMARRRVDLTGLKRVPWRKEASSDLVALERIALEARDVSGTGALVIIDGRGAMGAKGMCHSPLFVRGP